MAGASGVIGARLVPLLVASGHTVAGMSRSPEKADALRALGAEPVVCDVFAAADLEAAVVAFAPDAVVHQLTDLPDDVERVADFAARNNRIRTEGTRNLIAAVRAPPRIEIAAAARATAPLLEAPSGIVEIVEDGAD